MNLSNFSTAVVAFFVICEIFCFGQNSSQELFERISEPQNILRKPGQGSSSIPHSEDIGILAPVQIYQPPSTFTFFSASTLFHTDNVFLTRDDEVDTQAWLGMIGASYVPYATYRWTPRISIEGALMRYDRAAFADFDTQTLILANRFDLTDSKSVFWETTFSLRRFDGREASLGEFYRHMELESGVHWIQSLSQQRKLFFLGTVKMCGRQTSPGAEDRFEMSLTARFIYEFNANFNFQSFVRPAYRYYPHDFNGSHNDLNITAGFDAFWKPLRHVAISGGILWFNNYSDLSMEDYNACLPSISATVTLAF